MTFLADGTIADDIGEESESEGLLVGECKKLCCRFMFRLQ